MQRKTLLWSLLAAAAALVLVVIYRMAYVPQPGFDPPAVKQETHIQESTAAPEPSPWSLRWGSELAKVVDQAGTGVAGATVTFLTHSAPDQQPPVWHNRSAVTSEDGEFAIMPDVWHIADEQKKHSVSVKIEAKGFVPRSAEIGLNFAEDMGMIDLLRSGRIEGVLIDPNGLPFAKAPIQLNTRYTYKNPCVSHGIAGADNVSTDASGGFVFDNVTAGVHTLKFPGQTGRCAPDAEETPAIPFLEYMALETVHLDDGQVKTGVFIDLRQSRTVLKGKVVDLSNRPIAGVNAVLERVSTIYFGSGSTSTSTIMKTGLTDENGQYLLPHLAQGEYRLYAQYPSEEGKSARRGDPIEIILAGNQEASLDLVLPRQDDRQSRTSDGPLFEVPLPEDLAQDEFMVVDQRGNGIPGAKLTFAKTFTVQDRGHSSSQGKQDWEGAVLTTDARGRFTFPEAVGPVEGKQVQCHTVIEADGFAKRHVTLPPYVEERRIDLLPLTEISGRVIGKDGHPVKTTVSLVKGMIKRKNPMSMEMGVNADLPTQTDQEGRFRIQGISQGVYVLLCSESYSVGALQGWLVVDTQEDAVKDVVIDLGPNTCGVGGRVLDKGGNPVNGASVRLAAKLTQGISGGLSSTESELYRSEPTDASGRFSIQNVQPGVYVLEAVLEGSRQQTSDKRMIAVSDGQSIELELRLKN